MVLTLPTNSEQLTMVLTLQAETPFRLQARGVDDAKREVVYFERGIGTKELIVGTQEFQFPLPLSPQKLRLDLKFEVGSAKVLDVIAAPLKTSVLKLSRDDQDFVAFAKWVALNLAELPLTKQDQFPYQSAGGKYMLRLLPEIRNRVTGAVETTPARISRETGIIELSRAQLLKMTVPMRLVVLFHEYMHYRLNSRDESECDKRGLDIFLAMGFPLTEGLYAFAKVFRDKPALRQRVAVVLDYLYSYDLQHRR